MSAQAVTFVSPMKRGLKEMTAPETLANDRSYICFPDEKGTERTLSDSVSPFCPPVTFVSPMKRGLKARWISSASVSRKVTFVSPMKRGLKVKTSDRNSLSDSVTFVSPMKRGLKVTGFC